MKKAITIIGLITLISLNTMSQDLKGKVLLSGMLGISFNDGETSDYKSNRSESYYISAPVGYFISNKYAIGLIGDYSYRYSENLNKADTYSYESTSKTNSYSMGPFVRRYFPVVKKLMVFVHLDGKFGTKKYEYTSLKSDSSTYENNETVSLFKSDLYPGLSYRITNKLMLEAAFAKISFSSSNGEITRDNDDPEKIKSSSFSFRANYLSFGLTLAL